MSTLTKLLPYALLTFVGIAGWSMESTALLTMVVIGTACVAIGTALASRPYVAQTASSVVDLTSYNEEHHHQQHQ